MKNVRTINTLFTPITTTHKPPLRDELECWTFQERVARKKCFGYLSDQEYSRLWNSRYQYVGLLSLCQVLRQDGYDVNYFIPDDIDDHLLAAIANCDLLLITSFTFNFNDAVTLTRQIREIRPDLLIGIGGHHAPYLPEESLRIDNGKLFNFTMKGYSENSIREVPKAYSRGGVEAFAEISQIAYIDSRGTFIQNPKTHLPSLETIPLPANDLISHDLTGTRVFSAYGCPHRCLMCCHGIEESYSERPLELFEAELRYLIEEKGVRYVYIGDPTLGANERRFKEIVEILNSFPQAKWGGQTRLSTARRDSFMKVIADSQCVHLELGVETLSQRLSNIIRKESNNAIAEDTIYGFKDRVPNVYLETNWMFGIPGANENDINIDKEKMKQFIRDGIDICLGVFVPFPGTPFFHDPEGHGIVIVDNNFDNYTMYGAPVFSQVNGLSQAELYETYIQIVRDLQDVLRTTYGGGFAAVQTAVEKWSRSRM
jgi:anaerobic magnesium-protoporphyrin IX monomethyl ester cyclase